MSILADAPRCVGPFAKIALAIGASIANGVYGALAAVDTAPEEAKEGDVETTAPFGGSFGVINSDVYEGPGKPTTIPVEVGCLPLVTRVVLPAHGKCGPPKGKKAIRHLGPEKHSEGVEHMVVPAEKDGNPTIGKGFGVVTVPLPVTVEKHAGVEKAIEPK